MRIKIIILAGLWSMHGLMASTAKDVVQALFAPSPDQNKIIDLIKKLMPNEVNLDVSISEWHTPLTAAIALGNWGAVEELLQLPNINPNHYIKGKAQPPLWLALWYTKNKNADLGVKIVDTLLTYRALPITDSFNGYTELNNLGISGFLNTGLKDKFDLAQAFSYASQEPVKIDRLTTILGKAKDKITAQSFMNINVNKAGSAPVVMNLNLLAAPLAAVQYNAISILEASNVLDALLKQIPGIAEVKMPDTDQYPIGFQVVLDNELLFGKLLSQMKPALLEAYNKKGDTLLSYIIKNSDWAKPGTKASVLLLIERVPSLLTKKDGNGTGSLPINLLVEQIIQGKYPDPIIATIKVFKDKGSDTQEAIAQAGTISDPSLRARVKTALGVVTDPQIIIDDLNKLYVILNQIKTLVLH